MCRKAYDEVYLDFMIQKTRYLFKLIARSDIEAFSTIESYMCCDYRKYMDNGNPLYLNKTPKQILSSIGIQCQHDMEISEEYDEFIMEWIADIYTYMQWNYNLSSKEIVKKIKPNELYRKFNPLHEMSIKNAVERLVEMHQINI